MSRSFLIYVDRRTTLRKNRSQKNSQRTEVNTMEEKSNWITV